MVRASDEANDNSAGPGVAAKTKTAKAKVTISRKTPELKLSFIQRDIMTQNLLLQLIVIRTQNIYVKDLVLTKYL